MGARQSSTACDETSPAAAIAPAAKNIEDVPNAKINPGSVNPNSVPPSIPRGPTGAMPQMMRPETFEEKLYRKVCYELASCTCFDINIDTLPL